MAKRHFDPSVVEAQENLLIDYQFLLQERMSKKGISQSELADMAGISKARLSQIMSDAANPTVKTFAELFHALGDRVRISAAPTDVAAAEQTREDREDQAGKWKWLQPIRLAAPIDAEMVALMKRSSAPADETGASNDNYGNRRVLHFDSDVVTAFIFETEAA